MSAKSQARKKTRHANRQRAKAAEAEKEKAALTHTAIQLSGSGAVIWIPVGEGVNHQKILEFDASPYRFTSIRGEKGIVALKKPPAELCAEDIQAINHTCDIAEGPKNKTVKKIIAGALAQVFRGERISLYEIGPGKFPISPYFVRLDIEHEYHGIECDPKCIRALQKQGYKASHCDEPLYIERAESTTSIVTSVYALQFVIDEKLPSKLDQLLSDDGLFVANMYVDPQEQKLRSTRRNQSARERLRTILKEANINHLVIEDPGCQANEYWIISKPGNQKNVHELGKAVTAQCIRAYTA